MDTNIDKIFPTQEQKCQTERVFKDKSWEMYCTSAVFLPNEKNPQY